MSIKNSIQDNEKNRIKYFKKAVISSYILNVTAYITIQAQTNTVSKYFQYFTMEVSHILRKQIWLPYPF